jgi:hypothetical protein
MGHGVCPARCDGHAAFSAERVSGSTIEARTVVLGRADVYHRDARGQLRYSGLRPLCELELENLIEQVLCLPAESGDYSFQYEAGQFRTETVEFEDEYDAHHGVFSTAIENNRERRARNVASRAHPLSPPSTGWITSRWSRRRCDCRLSAAAQRARRADSGRCGGNSARICEAWCE